MNTTLTARPVSSVDLNTRVAAVDWASTECQDVGWADLSSCGIK